MRGHAKGPFNSVTTNGANPVLRVQKQFKLTSLVPSLTMQVEASLTEPVLLKIVSFVKTVFTTGTVIVGNSNVNNAYLAAGDTTLTALGFNAEKRFVLTEPTTLTATLTGGSAGGEVWIFLDA